MTDPLPRRIAWFAPWTWKRGPWLAVFIILPPLYLLLVILAEQLAGNEPGWRRSVVSIIRAPLEPLRRPFRRQATIKGAELYADCEVCGEPAVVRIWEGVIVSDRRGVQCRRFCDQHHREYVDGPADALKPITPLPLGFH